VSRKALLVASSLLYAAGFAAWIVAPAFVGFAAGFVLWGVSSALMSGTFEAFLYDGLAACNAASSYARIMGWATSLAMLATLAGTALAAPLFAIGGYPLVGWVSVGIALVQGALALSLPSPPRTAEADATADTDGCGGDAPGARSEHPTILGRYAGMLVDGVSEATRIRTVRHAVLIVAALYGFLAFDEYFPVVAREHGAATGVVPLLMAVTVAGQVIGSALAGRTAGMRNRTLAGVLVGAALLLMTGSVYGGLTGFVAIGAGYGAAHNVIIVAEARLQDAITGPARATVTSTYGLLSELLALSIYGTVAVGSGWLPVSTMIAALTVPLLVVAVLVSRWLP
jgi:MFS family permease